MDVPTEWAAAHGIRFKLGNSVFQVSGAVASDPFAMACLVMAICILAIVLVRDQYAITSLVMTTPILSAIYVLCRILDAGDKLPFRTSVVALVVALLVVGTTFTAMVMLNRSNGRSGNSVATGVNNSKSP
jgi:hypothetical protein